MGSYANSVLANGEHVVYETKLHWSIYIPSFLLYLIPIDFLFFPFVIIRRRTSKFVITNRRVILKTGFISLTAFNVFLTKIEGYISAKGFFRRIFNYGTIVVRGAGGFSQAFTGIADPFMFKRMVDEACGNG